MVGNTSNNDYVNPVIIANYLDNQSPDPALIGLRILSNNSFELELKGWDYSGNSNQSGKVALMIVEGSLPLDFEESLCQWYGQSCTWCRYCGN